MLGHPDVFASRLNALRTVGYVMAMLDSKIPYVMSCFHQIGGQSKAFGIIDYNPSDKNTEVKLTPVFGAFALIGQAFEGAKTHFPVTIDASLPPLEYGLKRTFAHGFIKDNGRTGLLITNNLPVEKKLKLAAMQKGRNIANVKHMYTTGKSLGDTTMVKLGEQLLLEKTVAAGEVILPPYSVNYLEF
jgi:hypothetical protein